MRSTCYLTDKEYERLITKVMHLDMDRVIRLSTLNHQDLVKATI